ncbi:hypothetical protein [Saccharothrix violaceirubra]|uniref:Uncharacterized protein n=1 Tax=Saccharothrix violaceirubra TaxID=413306 RepID=A0A7W7WX42_9PSEU|nr:hypothetical protein [Saccharothrix violaceirubra]MBB4966228.1 hypothetical protein [Saccharothrix violaceirubra]
MTDPRRRVRATTKSFQDAAGTGRLPAVDDRRAGSLTVAAVLSDSRPPR